MKNAVSAITLLKSFCEAYFVLRDAKKAMQLFTKDVKVTGVTDDGAVLDFDGTLKAFEQNMKQHPAAASLEYIQEEQFVPMDGIDIAFIRVRITVNGVPIIGSFTGCVRSTDPSKICALHASVHSKATKKAHDVLHSAPSGRGKSLRELLTGVSPQSELQESILDETQTAIYVIDKETYELYYANRRGFEIYEKPLTNYTGKTCYELFGGSDKVCGHCPAVDLDEAAAPVEEYLPDLKKYISIVTRPFSWQGRPAFIQYITDITAQKLAQQQNEKLAEKLSSVNTQLSAIISTAPSAIAAFEVVDGCRLVPTYLSDGWQRITGYDVPSFINDYATGKMTAIPPDDAEALRQALRKGASSRTEIKGTSRVICADGRQIWVAYNLVPTTDDKGKLVYYGTFTDITPQMDTQRQMADLIHNVPGGVCLYKAQDGELTPIVISEQLSRFLGLDAFKHVSETHDLNYGDVLPEDLPAFKQAVYEAMQTHKLSHTYRSRNAKTGKISWLLVQANAVPQPDGSLLAYASYSDVTEAKENEERLRRSEKELEAAVEQFDGWFWTYDSKTKTAHMYNRIQNEFGLPAAIHNYPESWLEMGYVEPETVEAYRDAFRRIDEGEPEVHFEGRMRVIDGKVHWVAFNMRTLYTDEGEGYITVCMAEIIDELKRLQARLQIEERRPDYGGKNLMRYVMSNLSTDRVIRNGSAMDDYAEITEVISIEDNAKRVAGFIPDEKERAKFMALHNTQTLIDAYDADELEHSVEYRLNTVRRGILWCRSILRILRDPSTDQLLMFEYCYNIQDEKIDQLAKETLLNEGYEFLVVVDASTDTGRAVQVSEDYDDDFYETLENVSDVVGAYIDARCIDINKEEIKQSMRLENVLKQLEKNSLYDVYFGIMSDDGKKLRKRMRYAYVDKAAGLICQTRSDVTDAFIAEQKRSEQLTKALAAAEAATNAKSEFLSRMSHEIRTPMNAIMGMTEIARDNSSDYAQVLDCLDKINISSKYLLTLINDILEMSRIESGRVQIQDSEFSFQTLLSGVATIIQPLAQNSELRYDFVENAKPDSYYYGDMMRIQQVLVNVLSNAVKFTKKGGRVRFVVDIEKSTKTETTFKFTVEDTGIGISKEFLPRLFKPFSQENTGNTSMYGGSGLGLAISKSILAEMRGTIEVESYEGVGTTFTITLPLRRLNGEPEKAVEAQSKSRAKLGKSGNIEGCKILLVEDHPLNVTVATKLLQRRGAEVEVAENGKIAVDMFENSQLGDFDVILMDIRMPVMDGLDAAKAIRALPRKDAQEIPIIAMTANALDEDRRRTKEAGMDAHISKPIEPIVLYDTISQFYSQ